MRLFTIQAFDEIITGVGPWYTPESCQDLLGSADWLILNALTSAPANGALLTCTFQHSANGRDWLDVPDQVPITNVEALFDGSHKGYIPFGKVVLTFVRIKSSLFSASQQCRLKLIVTGRSSIVAPASALVGSRTAQASALRNGGQML